MPRGSHGSLENDQARETSRDERDPAQRAFDQARDALEPMQSSIALSGPVLAARINDARAMTRSMMETQTRLAMAWVDLAWSPLIAMSRMMRGGQDGAGTGAPGPR